MCTEDHKVVLYSLLLYMLDATHCIANSILSACVASLTLTLTLTLALMGIVDKHFEKFIRNHMHGLRPHAVKQLYAKMQ